MVMSRLFGPCLKPTASPDLEVRVAVEEPPAIWGEVPPVSSASVVRPTASPSSGSATHVIPRSSLGPPTNLMDDEQPEWSFELEPGKWKTYSIAESQELDRYWKVFCDLGASGEPGACVANINLMRRSATVDFATMTCQVGSGRPRTLVRKLHDPGWLSNRFFFCAFTDALGRAGVSVETAPEDMFDLNFNQDFRGMRDDGRKLSRGGFSYALPVGWKRFAVNVKGQYDDGQNGWLKEDESGWAVAYHGTSGDSLPGILAAGFHVGAGQKFAENTGAGIYCTRFIDVAQHYSRPKKVDGHWVQIVLQLRVKPSAIKEITDPKATDFEKQYWVINDPSDMRAYGVLIREFHLAEFVPPEAKVYGYKHPAVKSALRQIQLEVAADKR